MLSPKRHSFGDQAEASYTFGDISTWDIVTVSLINGPLARFLILATVGILCVAKELDCPLVVTACVNYLEAVPWVEGKEEEMLRVVPLIGPEAEPEQIEYMITEDDDAPLLIADEVIKLEVKDCVKNLFDRFFQCLEAVDSEEATSKKREEWIEALPWLRSTLDREIESTLRCGYEALGDNERNLFLYIACFFAGSKVDNFKRYFSNSSLEVNHGLQLLVQKSLVSVENGSVRMHSLLEQMGRETVKKRSMDNPAKPDFLTDTMDIYDALDENTATGNVLGIKLYTSTGEKIQIKALSKG
ncbi:hypothetical protein Bca101_060852 [Brassica carinata]